LPPFAASPIAKVLEGNMLLERAMGIEPMSEAWEDNKTFTQRLHFAFFPQSTEIGTFFQETSVPLSG
jgi:hypothetical protein